MAKKFLPLAIGTALAATAVTVFNAPEAQAACVDNPITVNNNCDTFNPSGPSVFEYTFTDGTITSASNQGPSKWQVRLNTNDPGTGVTGLSATFFSAANPGGVQTALGSFNPIAPIPAYTAISSFPFTGVNKVVISGTLIGNPPAIATQFFSGAIRFNSTGTESGIGILDDEAGQGGGVAAGTLSLVSFEREEVPGPLPILGAATAFGFSRKLRRRTKAVA